MPEGYTGGLGPEGTAALRDFVEQGGTLAALDSAALFAIDELRLPVKNALAGVPPADFYCPGSILAARADLAHPLAHGLPERTPVWFEGSPAFEVEKATRSSPAGSWEAPGSRARPPSSRCRSGRGGSCSSASGRSTARRAA
jgi:hypothetical protein